jgi:hypothetical protein
MKRDMRVLDSMRRLTEAIILQSIEDLWNSRYRGESMAFFRGEGFQICAKMANLTLAKQSKFLLLFRRQFVCQKV